MFEGKGGGTEFLFIASSMVGVVDRNPHSSLITRGHKIHNVGMCNQILFHMAIDHYVPTADVLQTLLLACTIFFFSFLSMGEGGGGSFVMNEMP